MNIALIAHDAKKKLMQNFCIAYRGILSKNELYATGTTGRLVEEVTNLSIHKFLAGHLGGEQQIGAQIEHNQMDLVIFLRDPLTSKNHEPDVNNSGNDAAIMVAEGVAGSVEAFVAMMNEEALALGATNTNFTNPHGLNDENHYTTVYDMYLIMNEAVNYSLFNEIISMDSYTTVYTDKNGASKEISVNNTNRYLQGEAVPEGLTVLGGKTGTTSAAGHCLSLITKDSSGNPYISIVMKAESGDLLYSQMTDLLEEINN